jgi:hypothetical protein
MPAMTRIVIVAVAVVAVVAGAATVIAAPRVYYETPFGETVVKPKRIEFSDLTLTRLKWESWGRRQARGTGRGRVNTCEPSCGDGEIVRGRARLKMFKRHRRGGRRFYGCMTGRTTAGGRAYRVEWPPGCAG